MWKKLTVGTNTFYVKQEVNSEFVRTVLSDLIFLWEEHTTCDAAIERFKESNPTIKAPDRSVLAFISSLTDETECEISHEKTAASISLKMSQNVIPKMKYEFTLSLKTPDAVFREITFPLIMLVSEFKHRENILCQCLEAKDSEIMEYKLEGFKISRKNVITPKFEKEEYLSASKQNIEERLKSNIKSSSDVFLEDLNNLHPALESVISKTSTESLKHGKLYEVQKEILPKAVEEGKSPPKRKCDPAPVKRIAGSKKRIL